MPKILKKTTSSNSAIDPVSRDVIRASKDGDVQLLQNLLRHDIPAKVMINALCYSVINAHLPCCRALLDRETDVNGMGIYGSTPLTTAASTLNLEIVRMLLQRGANVNVSDEVGRTPLLAAILNIGERDLIRLLLEAGSEANLADSRGLTPLWATVLYNGNPYIMRLLLEYGANHTVTYFGKTLLEVALKNNLKEFAYILAALPKSS